jgi:hypothetical protein
MSQQTGLSSAVRLVVNISGAPVELQRTVDVAEHLTRNVIRGVDYDVIGELGVADFHTLAQEPGI